MSPREVQGLQALAENHGGSLTINPETGLPEAGFLDKLLPAIIGFALAPLTAGTSLAFLGATPFASALTVGGLQTLRTGDIGKGISAGLGAYGGAGLQASLAGAGASALSGEATSLAANEAGKLAGEEAVRVGMQQGLSEEAINQLRMQAIDEAGSATARVATDATPFEKLTAGASQATSSPAAMGQFAKDNFKNIAYAAGPVLADQAVTSKLPVTTTRPGMISPYTFDPYSGTYTAAMPYRAAGGGLMDMDDGGYSPGQLDFTQRSEPVVRMAEGGVPGYAGGALVGDTDIFNYFKTPGLTDAQIAKDMQTFQVSAADIARATGTQNQQADYEKRFVNTLIAPGTDASEFLKATGAVGLKDQSLATAMQNAGLSQGAQYALTHAIDDKGYTGGIVDASTGKPVDFYNQIGYTAGALPGDQGGLEGLYGNINYGATGLQGLINSGKMTVAQAQNAALAELERAKLSLKDVEAATGKKFGDLFTPKKDDKKIDKIVTTGTGGGTTTDTGGTYTRDGTGLGGDLSTVLGLPPGVSGGGNTYVNPNGTITTRPDFSLTTNQVRDAYTKGGGSLGYEPYTPKTIEEFDTKYGSRLTGGSKQSLGYLTGKTKYSPVPYTETGEIMKPYSESVLGIPMASSKKMYLFDPATKTYKINPDYAIPTYDKDGKKSLDLTNQDVINYVKSPEYSNDDAFVSWMTANNLTPEQIAAATGMSIADVYKKIKKAKPVDAVVDTPVTGQNDGGGGGGGDMADGGLAAMARGGMAQQFDLGGYSDGGRLLRGPGDGVSDSIPATIGNKRPARLADGEFVVPARIVSELGNGSTEAGARKLYAMMDRVQKARRGTVGKGRVAKNSRSEKYLPA
jgi:hypothetical protein